jgi:hypothetical protein
MIKRVASAAIAVGGAMAAGAVYMRSRGRVRRVKAAKSSAVEEPQSHDVPREIGAADLDNLPSALSLQEIYNRVSHAS